MKPVSLFSQHLWRRFWAIASPYWRGEQRLRAWGLLLVLVLLMLAETRLAVMLNAQTGEFTSALAGGDRDRFWTAIRTCLLVLAVFVPVHALYYYARDYMGIHWRRWLTYRLLGRYFAGRRYYRLGISDEIDNPDQRIAEDVNVFTQRSLYFLLIFIGSLMQLVAFSNVLWSISPKLVYFLAAYATVGTALAVGVFGMPLMRLNFLQLRREANLRYGLVRVRENAESIAFYGGEAPELQQIKGTFAAAYANYRRLIRKQFGLNLFQQAYSQLTLVLPSIIIADAVLSGEVEVGRAIQAAGAFAVVLSAVSLIVENFESLSRFTAGIDRLDTLARALESEPGAGPSERRIRSSDGSTLAARHVTVETPQGEQTLVTDLNFELPTGGGLLIVGPSGCGKSSLLRAISGLWNSGEGEIQRPPDIDTLFLPQRPYMQIGSLRSQLLYPRPNRDVDDAHLADALDAVQLGGLIQRCGGLDQELDWSRVLSIGEQQRLAFARLLLINPRVAILDEATSALDSANEAVLYRRLRERNTTIVSIAHRESLLTYHTHVLELTGDGGWRLLTPEEFRRRNDVDTPAPAVAVV